MVCLGAGADDNRLAGAGSRTTHAVSLFAIGVWATNDAQQQGVALGARPLGEFRQFRKIKKYPLAGAAANVGRWNANLGRMFLAHG
jgi:hypothetical protein